MDVYTGCIVICEPSDTNCVSQCSREYQQNLTKCPCQEKCPNGCPCPEYDCPITTTVSTTTSTAVQARTLVLILYFNDALVTNDEGKVEYPTKDFMFLYGSKTEVYHSCSITWHGDFYVFGGFEEKRQITKLNKCKLERIGSLDYDFYGACVNVEENSIFLCFDSERRSSENKICRVGQGPLYSFSEIDQSVFEHRYSRIGANQGNTFIELLLY